MDDADANLRFRRPEAGEMEQTYAKGSRRLHHRTQPSGPPGSPAEPNGQSDRAGVDREAEG